MSEPTTNTNGKAASNGQAVTNGQASTNGQARKTTSRKPASQQDIAALIARTIRFRTSLHDLTHQASDLVKALKQHRRQSKAVEATLATIKQLKSLAG